MTYAVKESAGSRRVCAPARVRHDVWAWVSEEGPQTASAQSRPSTSMGIGGLFVRLMRDEAYRKEREALCPRDWDTADKLARCATGDCGGVELRCIEDDAHFLRRYDYPCRDGLCNGCVRNRMGQFFQKMEEVLIEWPMHQVVFTLPGDLRGVWEANRGPVSELMLRAARELVLDVFAQQWKGTPAVVAILHLTGCNGHIHPHVHVCVSHYGLSYDRRTLVGAEHNWFVSSKVLSTRWKGALLDGLTRLAKGTKRRPLRKLGVYLPKGLEAGEFFTLLERVRQKKSNVYVGPARPDPKGLLAYCVSGAYGGPIRDDQFIDVREGRVFYLDRPPRKHREDTPVGKPEPERAGRAKLKARPKMRKPPAVPRERSMQLVAFVGMYLQHWLPPHFKVVRYAGLYAPRMRERLDQARALWAQRERDDKGKAIEAAPPRRKLRRKERQCCPRCTGLIVMRVRPYRVHVREQGWPRPAPVPLQAMIAGAST